ncbi:hypothetical protein CH276_04390 [Rhodococcus sp. 06-470-2]|nr:hypothetical protein CH276_04390 [Rhodococcus sp. 06-470-2]OZE63013.1 hypothetical protein CH265_16935 [Rhodococcus sp. 05-2221-1B]
MERIYTWLRVEKCVDGRPPPNTSVLIGIAQVCALDGRTRYRSRANRGRSRRADKNDEKDAQAVEQGRKLREEHNPEQ